MDYLAIKDLKINQRFQLAGDVYNVRNVDYDDDYKTYRVTARAAGAEHNIELRVPEGTLFATLR